METKFQTSFIPKRPSSQTVGGPSMSVPHRRYTGSIFLTLAVLLFICSLVALGGTYIWNNYLISVAEEYKKELIAREAQYQIDAISKIKADSIRIDLAKRLLSTHLSASQIFSIISQLTVVNVQFLSMNVSPAQTPGGLIRVVLAGYGLNFSTVASQSDTLSQLDRIGLDKIVKNPIISDPTLNQNGTVSFSLTLSIDPNSILYDKSVVRQ